MLEELDEFVDAQASHADDGAEGASIQFVVVRDDHLPERVVAAQHYVAAFLPFDIEACHPEGGDAFAAGDPR
jgi:hypothetical protein